MQPKAVVLLSGGVDSTTVLAIAKADGFDPYALSFDYGQRHSAELSAVAGLLVVLAFRSTSLRRSISACSAAPP